MASLPLEFDWAEKHWQDPLTGTDVVCLSPPRKMHFRNIYFSSNMFTADGQYAVFYGYDETRNGVGCGHRSMWARNLTNGDVHELGPLPETPESLVPLIRACADAGYWAAAYHSHRVNAWDMSDPDAWAIIQFDIKAGTQRRIEPSKPISHVYFASFSADERYLYSPRKEKMHLQKTLGPEPFREMIAQDPGQQEMVRIDLETGQIETAHENIWHNGERFNLEHPAPHPSFANLFLSGARILDFDTGQWLDHIDDPAYPRWRGQGHYNWAPHSKRIYTHQWPSPNVHCISRIDVDTGENRWFASLPHVGFSQHCRVAPDETFLVGDGYEFDRNTLPPEIRKEIQQRLADGRADPVWCEFYLTDNLTNGGEVIWKYELPTESVLDDPKYWQDYDHMYTAYRHEGLDGARLLDADVLQNLDKVVKTTPVCQFRTMLRNPSMLGYRLESNAHVTPDSRWAVFQSSSEDNCFEVWAARVP